MIRRLLAVLQFAGIRPGSHRAYVRVNPVVGLALASAGIAALCGIAAFAVSHLIAFKEVAR